MYDDFEAIKRVAAALGLPIANGEQDQGFVNFSWLLANGGIEIVQPDSYYFGGLIRSVKVGRMAAACGKSIVPHMSGGGLGFLYNSHLVSVLSNAGEHHEFKGLGTDVRFTCSTSPLAGGQGKDQGADRPGLRRGRRSRLGGQTPAGRGVAGATPSGMGRTATRLRAASSHRPPALVTLLS